MCLYPTIIKNRKYTANKKNRGVIPPILDERTKYVPIGCGNCIECRKQKAREWQVRLMEDIKTNKNGKFITLTFSNEEITKLCKIETIQQLEGYEKDNEIATIAVRRFLERWRKKYKKSVRHWLVTEIGHAGTENIHLHGIIYTEESVETVEEIWSYGFIWPRKKTGWKGNYVTERTVNYITKYVTKREEKHKTYKSKILTSPGIGSNYVNRTDANNNKFKDKETDETYRTRTGHKIALPIYWRNKIYTEKEREKLWLNKLDQQIRWVCGEKVSIKDGEENYYKLLKHYQRINKQLGYGDKTKDWSRAEYEKQRRAIMIKKRTGEKKNTKHDCSRQYNAPRGY